jgi:exopolysaccharide production protein ExoQ
MLIGQPKIPATRPGASHSSADFATRWIALLLFAMAGFILTYTTSSLAEQHPNINPGWLVLLILLAPAVLIAVVSALPQLYEKLKALKAQLRWWHGLWFLLYVSTLVFRMREASAVQEQPLDTWALLRLVPELVVLFALMSQLIRKRPSWLTYLFRGLPLALTIYALVCAASAAWSVYPAWTLYKSIEFLLDLSVLVAVLANVQNMQQYKTLFNWAWTIYAVELVWVWMQWPLFPSQVFEDSRLRGIYPATACNAVGESGAVLAIIALCRLLPLSGRRTDRSDRSFYGLLFAFGTASLLLSQTRNAVAALVVGIITTFILSKRIWWAVLIAVLGATLWFFTGAGTAIMSYLQRDQTEAAMQSLTGRLDLWTYAWEQWSLHPFTGLGAYAGGRFAVMTQIGWDATTLHSDWMELLVGIGLLGLVPFAIALLGTCWFLLQSVGKSFLNAEERQLAYEAAALLAVMVVHSVFNTELSFHAPLAYFAVLGSAELLRRCKNSTAAIEKLSISI